MRRATIRRFRVLQPTDQRPVPTPASSDFRARPRDRGFEQEDQEDQEEEFGGALAKFGRRDASSRGLPKILS